MSRKTDISSHRPPPQAAIPAETNSKAVQGNSNSDVGKKNIPDPASQPQQERRSLGSRMIKKVSPAQHSGALATDIRTTSLQKARELKQELKQQLNNPASWNKRDQNAFEKKLGQCLIMLQQAQLPGQTCHELLDLRQSLQTAAGPQGTSQQYLQRTSQKVSKELVNTLHPEHWQDFVQAARESGGVTAVMASLKTVEEIIPELMDSVLSDDDAGPFRTMCEQKQLDLMMFSEFDLGAQLDAEQGRQQIAEGLAGDKSMEQARKDSMRQNFRLLKGATVVVENKSLREQGTSLSDAEMEARQRQLEQNTEDFFQGCDPAQAQAAMGMISQTPFVDLSVWLTMEFGRLLPDWGTLQLKGEQKSIDVQRDGDTITLSYNLAVAPAVMSQKQGQLCEVQYDRNTPLKASFQVKLQPGQEPQVSRPEVSCTLGNGELIFPS